MDKSVDEWQRRFRGMSVEEITRIWSLKADKKSSWTREASFHLAAAERMRLLGNMSIDLDTESRTQLCRQAEAIIEQLQSQNSIEPDRLAEINKVVGKSNAYFEKFGSRTARHYMFEQGIIDRLGDRRQVA